MIAERFHKLVKALFFCPAPSMKEAPSLEGALVVYGAWSPGDCGRGQVCTNRSITLSVGCPVVG